MNEDRLLDRLCTEEAVRLEVYDDKTGRACKKGDIIQGNITIGIGTNLMFPGAITVDEARFLARNRIRSVIAGLSRYSWFNSADEVRQEVIADMAFNMGLPTLLTFKKFIAALSNQRWKDAAAEMVDSAWFRQVGARAVHLKEQMLTGIRQ